MNHRGFLQDWKKKNDEMMKQDLWLGQMFQEIEIR